MAAIAESLGAWAMRRVHSPEIGSKAEAYAPVMAIFIATEFELSFQTKI